MLTPLAFDPGRPFPHISNLSLNLAVLIRDAAGQDRFARVKVPDSLPALVPADAARARPAGKRNRARREECYVWIEEIIAANLDALFPGHAGGGGASRSTSPATPISPSRNWKPKTCSRPSRKACGSASSAAWCGCR